MFLPLLPLLKRDGDFEASGAVTTRLMPPLDDDSAWSCAHDCRLILRVI